jgi:hypothetical protein
MPGQLLGDLERYRSIEASGFVDRREFLELKIRIAFQQRSR